MTPFQQQFPTWGDLCREQLRRRAIPYFLDVHAEIARRLPGLSPEARAAFAVTCAERAMRWHERLPPNDQRPFTLGWRHALDAIWQGLERKDEQSIRRVQEALASFRASPYCHSDGQEGPDDANDHPAAASIFAAECFAEGSARSAEWASERAFEQASNIADDELHLDPNLFVWDPAAEPMPFAKAAMQPVVQHEIRRQLATMELLETSAVGAEVLTMLRASAAWRS